MPVRPSPRAHHRPEPPDVLELKRLREARPELAAAADLELALLETFRRVQSRLPLPATLIADARPVRPRDDGRALLAFKDLPLTWSDFRLLLREVAELLRRADLMEAGTYQRLLAVTRDGRALEPIVEQFYDARSAAADAGEGEFADLQQALGLALRPFLARCAEAVLPRLDLSDWGRGRCPLCGAEPEFALITASFDRLLVCSSCTARWPFDPHACPFCDNRDPTRLTMLSSADRRYRVCACDACLRYIKAYDERHASRPLILPADAVATLPLDAAAMQRGYQG